MKDSYIAGIQQVGIGVDNADKAWNWYGKHLGFDVPIFNDEAEAALMTKYTGGTVYNRKAILALNMKGGGGFEIWQFKSRTPTPRGKDVKFGELGINAVILKAPSNSPDKISELLEEGAKDQSHIAGLPVFKDPRGNWFAYKESNHQFKNSHNNGGVCGAIIGVSDIEKSKAFYTKCFGFIELNTWDETKDGKSYTVTELNHPVSTQGGFAPLLGEISLFLIQCAEQPQEKIYENRFWGDLGFIHLCLDVYNMPALKERCITNGYEFTVDSEDSFGMESAAGRFAYIEDPDGTLIELVETHKVPICKKPAIAIDLKKRKGKPLAKWKIGMLSLARKQF